MSVAVVIPCWNEELCIRRVLEDYLQFFDNIYIIDNNSTDNSIKIAQEYNVNIIPEYTQGKGATIRKAFKELNYNYLVLTDCDCTYSAEDSYKLYQYIRKHKKVDMVIGNRLSSDYFKHKQKFNGFGNILFSKIASLKKRHNIKDLLSGSRVVARRFYKNITIEHNEFEVETELTLKANHIKFIDIDYKSRPKNSISNLNAIKDGWKIFKTLMKG